MGNLVVKNLVEKTGACIQPQLDFNLFFQLACSLRMLFHFVMQQHKTISIYIIQKIRIAPVISDYRNTYTYTYTYTYFRILLAMFSLNQIIFLCFFNGVKARNSL